MHFSDVVSCILSAETPKKVSSTPTRSPTILPPTPTHSPTVSSVPSPTVIPETPPDMQPKCKRASGYTYELHNGWISCR